jgi:hypothetical protein
LLIKWRRFERFVVKCQTGELIMQTVEEIYQQYIKPLPNTEKMRLIIKVSKDIKENEIIIEKPKTRSLLELEGLGAEIWEGIDPDKYVNELRNEWEHRP